MGSTGFTLNDREVDAIAIAHDELVSYLDVVGNEGQLDDEEMPTKKLEWACDLLRQLLDRHSQWEHEVAAIMGDERFGGVIGVPPVRAIIKPTPPSGSLPTTGPEPRGY